LLSLSDRTRNAPVSGQQWAAALSRTATFDSDVAYDGSLWMWRAGDYRGQADNVMIIGSQLRPLGQGAWVRSVDRVNVTLFGARGDYDPVAKNGTDDTAAIIAALRYALVNASNRPARLHFPAGNYLVTEPNVLGRWAGDGAPQGMAGVAITGDGMMASVLTLRNNENTPSWFWDNVHTAGAIVDDSLQFPMFEDLGFVGTGKGVVGGFRSGAMPNPSPSQGFRFSRCFFGGLSYPLSCEGQVNDSEMSFSGCRAIGTRGLINVDNSQSVNFTVLYTDVELYTGTVFNFLRGGQLTVIGGSYISFAQDGEDTFVLATCPPNTGTSATFTFIGIRTEAQNSKCKLLRIDGRDNDSSVRFINTAHATRLGGNCPDAIQLGGQGHWSLVFEDAFFSGYDGIHWKANGVPNYWTAPNTTPRAEFIRCRNIGREHVKWDAGTLGFTRIASLAAPTWEGGAAGAIKGRSGALEGSQLVSIDGWGERWPNTSDGGSATIAATVPLGARIVNIWVEKPALGQSDAPYQLQLVDGRGVEISIPAWGQGSSRSIVAPMKERHVAVLRGLLRPATDPASATVAVRAVRGQAGDRTIMPFAVAGARMTIEYYPS
jgi:hypothetical protein